jgi:hypothetical protein
VAVSTTEPNMTAIIDLNSEVLIDRSKVRDPYVCLLLSALGQQLVKGSPWVVLDKSIALAYEALLPSIAEQALQIAQ